MSDETTVPTSPDGYKSDLPQNIDGVANGTTIDRSHPGYQAAAKAAHEAGLTVAQFRKLLTHEARRVSAAKAASAPKPATPPTPTRPTAPTKPYAQMTMREKLAAAGHI